MKKVGILALQGDFAAHEEALRRAGGETLLVRNPDDFGKIGGLVIPGGESSSMLKLLAYDTMMDALKAFGCTKPIFGTCAGAILLATDVSNPKQESLGVMDIGVERNAYGRQNESSIVMIDAEPEFYKRTKQKKIEAIFIRAPIIRRVGDAVTVLARHKNDPILVEQGLHMAATFHPELTPDVSVHALFLSKL